MITLLMLDVDGVLTTGALPYDGDGNVVKSFHVQDGAGMRAWRLAGGVAAIVSGRESPAVRRRAEDLGISLVWQGVADKLPVFEALCRDVGVRPEAACVVGDDTLDLAPMKVCGYPIAVANAVPAVKRAARFVTRRRGGEGAVREAIDRLLRLNGWGG